MTELKPDPLMEILESVYEWGMSDSKKMSPKGIGLTCEEAHAAILELYVPREEVEEIKRQSNLPVNYCMTHKASYNWTSYQHKDCPYCMNTSLKSLLKESGEVLQGKHWSRCYESNECACGTEKVLTKLQEALK